jgi:hypothetical protein
LDKLPNLCPKTKSVKLKPITTRRIAFPVILFNPF